MGDSRCQIDIAFSVYGRDFEHHASVNYSGSTAEAIADWFNECFYIAQAEIRSREYERQEAQRIADTEKAERAELSRLREKYDAK